MSYVSFTDVSLSKMTGITQKIIVICDNPETQARVYMKARKEPDYSRIYRSKVGKFKIKHNPNYEITELTDEEFLNQA